MLSVDSFLIGSQVVDPEEPRLMLPRKAGANGPFYRVLPEYVARSPTPQN